MGKKKNFTAAFKLQVLHLKRNTATARKFGFGESCILLWKKEEDKLKKAIPALVIE